MNTQSREEALKMKAGDIPEKANLPEAGKKLPDGFVNPPIGKRGHLCLDPQGRYQPDWKSIKIHRTAQDMPDDLPFVCADNQPRLVRIGVWVDVPPDMADAVTSIEETVRSQNFDKGLLMSGDPPEMQIITMPVYNVSVIPSA